MKVLKGRPEIFLIVRRVHKDKVKCKPGGAQTSQTLLNVPANNACLIFEPAGSNISAKEGECAFMTIDKNRKIGTAAQGLNTQRSGPGKQIQHNPAANIAG